MKALKAFFDRVKPVLDIVSKEEKRSNRYAQKTAKELQEFCNYSETLYLENLQMRKLLKQQEYLLHLCMTDMRELELLKEQDSIRQMYKRYAGNEQMKKMIIELANLNVESLKYLNNGEQ